MERGRERGRGEEREREKGRGEERERERERERGRGEERERERGEGGKREREREGKGEERERGGGGRRERERVMPCVQSSKRFLKRKFHKRPWKPVSQLVCNSPSQVSQLLRATHEAVILVLQRAHESGHVLPVLLLLQLSLLFLRQLSLRRLRVLAIRLCWRLSPGLKKRRGRVFHLLRSYRVP